MSGILQTKPEYFSVTTVSGYILFTNVDKTMQDSFMDKEQDLTTATYGS